jgi:hypothetical protein
MGPIELPGERRWREFNSPEHRAARAQFEAAVAADPAWSATREVQRELAENRGFAEVHDFTEVRGYDQDGRPVLGDDWRAIHAWLDERRAAAQVAAIPIATWGPNGRGGMSPTNDLAEQIEEHQRQRIEAAKLRQWMQNRHLPPGVEAL